MHSPGLRGRQTQQWPRSAEFRHRELTLEFPAGGFFRWSNPTKKGSMHGILTYTKKYTIRGSYNQASHCSQKNLQIYKCNIVDGRNPANHLWYMKPYEKSNSPNWCRISSSTSIVIPKLEHIHGIWYWYMVMNILILWDYTPHETITSWPCIILYYT